jgi:2EXR family
MATTLHRFSEFPKELRLQIWTDALPGPRIIYVERHLFNKKKDETILTRGGPPEPTYFMSPSPNESIKSLLWACKESYEVVTKHYSRIFPFSQTWFCFPKDYLYVDWGSRFWSTEYFPEDFTRAPAPEERFNPGNLTRPECDPEMVGKIENLVMCSDNPYFGDEWLVAELLAVFTGVEVLVLADQFHGRHESAEEFVWLEGKLTDDLEVEKQPYLDLDAKSALISSLPWRCFGEYRLTKYVFESNFRREWGEKMKGTGRKIPKLLKKAVATRALKEALLEICGSEQNYWKLCDHGRQPRAGWPQYSEHLSLSQQIAFLELAQGRLGSEYPGDGPGRGLRGSCWQDLEPLFQRLDALIAESVFEELLIRDAEEMN